MWIARCATKHLQPWLDVSSARWCNRVGNGEKRVQSAAAAAASGAGSLEAQTMLFSLWRTTVQCRREASSLEAETAFSNGFFLPTYLSVAFAQPILLLIFTWNQDAWPIRTMEKIHTSSDNNGFTDILCLKGVLPWWPMLSN